MALIVCPHCGGQISDKAERCVHCGAVFMVQPPVPKNYGDFSVAEKDSLDAEFERMHPKYSIRKAVKKKRIQSVVINIIGAVFIIVAVIVLVNGSLRLDRFCETNGIHLQGNYVSTDFTEQEAEYFFNELGTDSFRCVQRDNETVLISGEDFDRLGFRLLGDILISILLIIIWFLMEIIYLVKHRKADRKILLNIKLYQAWLAQRNIRYEPRISSWHRKKFDAINITNYQL